VQAGLLAQVAKTRLSGLHSACLFEAMRKPAQPKMEEFLLCAVAWGRLARGVGVYADGVAVSAMLPNSSKGWL
jgi:hypothetical protein